MAIKALSNAGTFFHVLDADPCKVVDQVPVDPADLGKGTKPETKILEGATKFHMKTLDVFLMSHIYDNATGLSGSAGSAEVAIKTRTNQTNLDCVRFALMAFENFEDAAGNQQKVTKVKAQVNGREYDVADDDTLRLIGLRSIAELAEQVKERSEISGSVEKNSEPASPPSA